MGKGVEVSERMKRVVGWLDGETGKVLVAAVAVRLILAPWFFHPDLKIIFYNAHFLSDGVVNIYEYLAAHPGVSGLGQFVYPPLAYFLFGAWYILISPLAGGGFAGWLGQGNEAVVTPFIFRYQLLMKLPLLVADLGIGWLIGELFSDEKKKRLARYVWWFNPVSLYATVLMGQFDVLPALLTVVGVYLTLKRGKWWGAAVAMGAAAGLKTYALLLLPFVALAVGGGWRKRVGVFVLGLAVWAVGIVPFAGGAAFSEAVLFSGLAQRIFFAGFDLGFGERVLVVPVVWMGLFLWAWREKVGKERLVGYLAAVLLVVLGWSHFHPQWVMWVAPFVVILGVRQRAAWLAIGVFTLSYFGVVAGFADKFLGLGLASPVDAGLLFLSPLSQVWGKVIAPEFEMSLMHSLFAGSAMVTAYLGVKGEGKRG